MGRSAGLFDAYAELGGEPTISDYADEHLLDKQRVAQQVEEVER